MTLTLESPSADMDLVEESENPQTRVEHVMYGTSPGEIDTHAAELIPLDTVVYMALIRECRMKLGAQGILYADDIADRWGHQPGRQALVDRRTNTLRRLASIVDPELRVVTHSELEKAGAVEPLDAAILRGIKANTTKAMRPYTTFQTQVIRSCMNVLNAEPGELMKAGWCVSASHNWQEDIWTYEGGECTFDKSLPSGWKIPTRYVAPGFRMERQDKYDALGRMKMPAAATAPYLLQNDHADRVRVVEHKEDIPGELERLQKGISRVGLEMVRTASAVLLNNPTASDKVHTLNLDCWNWRKEDVTDEALLAEARAELEAALYTLTA